MKRQRKLVSLTPDLVILILRKVAKNDRENVGVYRLVCKNAASDMILKTLMPRQSLLSRNLREELCLTQFNPKSHNWNIVEAKIIHELLITSEVTCVKLERRLGKTMLLLSIACAYVCSNRNTNISFIDASPSEVQLVISKFKLLQKNWFLNTSIKSISNTKFYIPFTNSTISFCEPFELYTLIQSSDQNLILIDEIYNSGIDYAQKIFIPFLLQSNCPVICTGSPTDNRFANLWTNENNDVLLSIIKTITTIRGDLSNIRVTEALKRKSTIK